MFKSYLKQFGGNRAKLKTLGKEFVSEKLSAAGVSYIVTEKNRIRRCLWFIGLFGCLTFMGYMTGKVISEYLRYPKMLIKEDVIMPRLAFPAVTVCSLNPISQSYPADASLRHHWKLRKLLNTTLPSKSRSKTRKPCMREPLCKWSWFQEYCECMDSPCQTEFCLPNNETHCICSAAICTNKKFVCPKVDDVSAPWSKNLCVCDVTDVYNTSISQPKKSNITDILSRIDDDAVGAIVQLVWNSNSYDLSDVEEGLMPTMDEIYDYGITFDSLVASCSFETYKCNRDNFTILYHPKYGKCYMFNYAGRKMSPPMQPIHTNNYGSNSGLRLLLRVSDQEDVLDLVRREVGARIVVHDPYQLPFIAEYGVNLRPFDMTAVGVSMSTMTRLPDPWGNCVNKERSDSDREPYSILGCEKQCGFQYMTRKCNCTMRHLMHGSILSRNNTQYPLCDLSVIEQKDCVNKAVDELEKRMIDCNCKPPCNETVYSFSVTSSELNMDYYKMVKAIRTMAVTPDGNLTYISASDQKSMIGVKVYYNTFQVSTQSEVKSYSWETLIANVGGNLGFFMGLTLITFLEIVEFLWDILSTVCKPPEENKVYTVPNASRAPTAPMTKMWTASTPEENQYETT